MAWVLPKALTLVGTVTAVVFLAFFPFECDASRGAFGCRGTAAFHYGSRPEGVLQAAAAALLIGGIAGVITWAATAKPSPFRSVTRGTLTIALMLLIPVSLLSFTYMVFWGPPLALLLIFLIWRNR